MGSFRWSYVFRSWRLTFLSISPAKLFFQSLGPFQKALAYIGMQKFLNFQIDSCFMLGFKHRNVFYLSEVLFSGFGWHPRGRAHQGNFPPDFCVTLCKNYINQKFPWSGPQKCRTNQTQTHYADWVKFDIENASVRSNNIKCVNMDLKHSQLHRKYPRRFWKMKLDFENDLKHFFRFFIGGIFGTSARSADGLNVCQHVSIANLPS